MKNVLILLLAMALPFAALAKRTPGEKVGVEFAETIFDFGTVDSDKGPVVHTFEYTNTGSGAVAVVSAVASCGCTRPEYTKKPVGAGKKGSVKVNFNTLGQKGEINKDVKIRFRNADGKSEQVVLRISGVVIPK